MKKLVQKNSEIDVQEQLEFCLSGKRSGMISKLVNRDYNNCGEPISNRFLDRWEYSRLQ